MARLPEILIGGELESEEEQRLKLLGLVKEYLQNQFGVSLQDDATVAVSEESKKPESFSYPNAPHLPVIPLESVLPERTSEERVAKVAVLSGVRARTQEDINRDLERLGFSIRLLVSEEDRVRAEVDAWLDRNQMTPRTALICVEEIVRDLRQKQVAAKEREVREHLWKKMPRR